MNTTLPPTPFTVIGGFLGAGKTTLLNHVLANADGLRCAVLVNDFGAINIDASLVAAHDGQTVSLSNGCICCSMASGFIETMLTVTAKRQRFDHILVEASGVSEPQRILDFARLDPELAPGAIVVLVDACELPVRLADAATGDLVARQLVAADILLINKADLVSQQALERIEATAETYNSTAVLLRVAHARVPLSVIFEPDLSLAGASSNIGNRFDSHITSTETRAEHLHPTSVVQGAIPTPAKATRSPSEQSADRFHTISLSGSTAITRNELEAMDASLGDDIIRAKGILQLIGEPGWWSWQRVGRRSQVTSLMSDQAAAPPIARSAKDPSTALVAVLIATGGLQPDLIALPSGVELH